MHEWQPRQLGLRFALRAFANTAGPRSALRFASTRVEWPDIGLSQPANLARCRSAAREWAERNLMTDRRKMSGARRLKSLNNFGGRRRMSRQSLRRSFDEASRTVIDGWTQGELALRCDGARAATRANGHTSDDKEIEETRRNQQRRQRRHHAFQLAPAPSPSRSRNIGRFVIGGALAVTGIILAAGGLAMTVNYTVAGATGLDRVLLGGLAAGSDVLALLTPSAAAYLWRIRRHATAAVAGVLWIIAAGTTLQNLSGFVGSYGDSFITGREAAKHPTKSSVRQAGPSANRAESDHRKPIDRRNYHRNPQRVGEKNR